MSIFNNPQTNRLQSSEIPIQPKKSRSIVSDADYTRTSWSSGPLSDDLKYTNCITFRNLSKFEETYEVCSDEEVYIFLMLSLRILFIFISVAISLFVFHLLVVFVAAAVFSLLYVIFFLCNFMIKIG